MTSNLTLPFEDEPTPPAEPPETSTRGSITRLDRVPDWAAPSARPVDQPARDAAVDPSCNVVLEASAGTGKTRVLVDRYVNLLRAGVDPDHILAITFTRKAAAEMRERIVDRLREASRFSAADLARWRDLKERLHDIAISTIDAFCLSLLREFPLEADVDPAFELADETELPRLVADTLDHTFRICRALARDDDDVALVFAQLGERRLRVGLATLLDRRLVAPAALGRYLARAPRDLTAAEACRQAADRLRVHLAGVGGGLEPFLAAGPIRHPHFAMLADDLRRFCRGESRFDVRQEQAAFRVLADRLRTYFLTTDGRPRDAVFRGVEYRAADCVSDATWKRHRQLASEIAPGIGGALKAFRRDLNVVQARGVSRMFQIALRQYERQLESRALLDFSGVLERAIRLLKEMDEFAASRFRLEARYRHVLVDEFQDTSRAQWDLVEQLVRNWSEGLGASADALAPSIFIVGDRKQSIYGFRDADVGVLDDAVAFVRLLRPSGDPRKSISVSFRSATPVLAFVNDVFDAIAAETPSRRDAFRFAERDRFPIESTDSRQLSVVGIVADASVRRNADHVAAEIARLLADGVVRDRASNCSRSVRAGDVAILFRSRDSHREFERALQVRGVSTYVYKGLGFFEADEVQDVVAVVRFLADPRSNLRAAALLRSRLVRLSDRAVARLAPGLSDAIMQPELPPAAALLDADDRAVLDRLRQSVPGWLAKVDRLPPWELVSGILQETAYAYEIRGPGKRQARENLKKLGATVRRFQNRGYATISRVAEHLDELAVGDESNAALDAQDAVSLMTVHAAKGLEFPIVFLVNLGRGTGGPRAPIRVTADFEGQPSIAIADFQSDADEDAQAREREETKRLLYVAMTRGRDRLYLSATLKDGVCRMGRGSLGEVLPSSLRDLFAQAVPADEDRHLDWRAADERAHRLRVPSIAFESFQRPSEMVETTAPEASAIDDFTLARTAGLEEA